MGGARTVVPQTHPGNGPLSSLRHVWGLLVLLVPVQALAAYTDYLPPAEQGDASAQAYVGYLYYIGAEGAPLDPVRAAYWFRLAATAGISDAQYNLALLLVHGTGVPADPAEALHWFEAAALQGHAPAQLQLATLYHLGQGVAPDLPQAVLWYRRAALSGEPTAQYNLALLHHRGEAASQDPAMASYWLQQAAAQGHAPALQALEGAGKAAPTDDSTPQTLRRIYQLLHAHEADKDQTALVTLERLAMLQNSDAQLLLGALYYLGRGVPRDRRLAWHWCKTAANQGQLLAQYLCAHIAYTGTGMDAPNLQQARAWYQQAARRGLQAARGILLRWDRLDGEALREEALVRFSLLLHSRTTAELAAAIQTTQWYQYSILPEHDAPAGTSLLSAGGPNLSLSGRALAEARTQYEVGIQLQLGTIGRGTDPDMALQWFLKAARQGYPPAQYKVGMAYTRGVGAAPDAALAMQWLRRAAMQNYGVAQRQLAMALLLDGGVQEATRAYAWFSLAARTGQPMEQAPLTLLERTLDAGALQSGRNMAAQLAEAMNAARTAHE